MLSNQARAKNPAAISHARLLGDVPHGTIVVAAMPFEQRLAALRLVVRLRKRRHYSIELTFILI